MSKEIIVRYRDDNDHMAVRGGEYVQDLIMLVDEYADYQGCRNCEHQPEPLRMCAWGERRDTVEPICTGWKLRGSVKEGI